MKAPEVQQADPEADCAEGGRHPRLARQVFGQDAAIANWLAAEASGRRHHAWLLTGASGIGKATLAWKLAAHVLDGTVRDIAHGPDPDSGLMHRIAALSEPRLRLLRRAWDRKLERHKATISVDDVRELRGFFQLSAADRGARVVIVDAADEMNPQAANALLKSLEEPPKDVVFLLIAASPAAILPTIRSRCRQLSCAALSEDDIASALAGLDVDASAPALGVLALGSAGAALRLAQHDGAAVYGEITRLFTPRGLNQSGAHSLADSLGGKGMGERQDVVFDLLQTFVARLALAGAGGALTAVSQTEHDVLTRLGHGRAKEWADLAARLGPRLRHGRAVNLDPGLLLLDTMRKIEGLAA